MTFKLMPIVVTAHLMGGNAAAGDATWFWTRQRQREGDTRAMTVVYPAVLACWLGWRSPC